MSAGQTLREIATARTDLSVVEIEHCEALVKDLGLLADLAFADLILWLPVWNQGGYVAAAQVRPTTASTRLPGDMLAAFMPKGRRPELDLAWTAARHGQVRAREDPVVPAGDEATAVSLSKVSAVIAVLGRISSPAVRTGGSLERAYLQAADDLLAMIRVGDFPFPEASAGFGITGTEARVGDGLIRLDPGGRVLFASPNASSAFRRLGQAADLQGSALSLVAGRIAKRSGQVGPGADASLAVVAGGRIPGETELVTSSANVTLRAIPLRGHAGPGGALVLVRDVTELRRRERALISKDATIREIHHRVKNNLQTVAALLRMQARRLAEPGAAAALAEAERRVSAIAVVHDLLAHEVSEDVEFDLVAARLLALVSQTAVPEESGRDFVRTGSFGTLPAAQATALSMALVEILANAVEHGAGQVTLDATTVAGYPGPELVVQISDEGPGFGDVDIHASPRLGLRIVTTLVAEELRGELQSRRVGSRTVVELRLPAPTREQ